MTPPRPLHRVDAAIRVTAVVTTVALAGIAGAISYQHLLTLAVRHGQTGWRAAGFPLSVDGLEVVASLVLLADRRDQRPSGWLPWAALSAGAIASLFANVAVAEPDPIARTIAGWPALALITAIKLLSGLLEHPATPYGPDRNLPAGTVHRAASGVREDPVENGATPTRPQPPRLPVDLMRRIPVDPAAYQRWQTTWAELRDGDQDKPALASRLGVSTRHLDFVTAAGRAGLLDDPTPPAHRIARLATDDTPPPPSTTDQALTPAPPTP